MVKRLSAKKLRCRINPIFKKIKSEKVYNFLHEQTNVWCVMSYKKTLITLTFHYTVFLLICKKKSQLSTIKYQLYHCMMETQKSDEFHYPCIRLFLIRIKFLFVLLLSQFFQSSFSDQRHRHSLFLEKWFDWTIWRAHERTWEKFIWPMTG